MARPAPRDDSYAPAYAKSYDGSADVDLTAEFTQCPHSAGEVIATNAHASSTETLVVCFQGLPTTDVAISIAPGNTIWIRGAFVAIKATTGADITATFLWQGGAT